MSDYDRGAYSPPTDAPLSFDARQPVRGARPVPFTLIISLLVLAGLGAAIFVFYQSGVRKAGQPPTAVGQPIAGIKAPPPAESQPQDPAAGLQIYKAENGQPPATTLPQFAPPPEQPLPRTAPQTAVAAIPAAPVTAASAPPALRPSIPSQAATAPAPAAPIAQPPVQKSASVASSPKPTPAPTPTPAPIQKAAVTPPPAAKAAPVKAPAPPATKAPAAPAAATAGAAVQIGAFSSQALADKGWSDASAVAPGMAAGKGKSVERVDKDGKTLFRTQVTGFGSRADATAFCEKLKAAGKACFVK